jgi:hypothetical protein
MDWENLLPENLREAAYEAGSEYAWNRENALEVIKVISSHGYVILRVEIWLPTKPGPTIPTPFVYFWRLRTDTPHQKHPKSANEFVGTFEWDEADTSHKGMEPYFNFVAQARDS